MYICFICIEKILLLFLKEFNEQYVIYQKDIIFVSTKPKVNHYEIKNLCCIVLPFSVMLSIECELATSGDELHPPYL